MGDTVGCRGAPSGRRNTAGSWGAAGGRVGRAGMFGEGQSGWWSIGLWEVAPRIGVHQITHHRHSQRGRGSTRFYSAQAVYASSLFVHFRSSGPFLKLGKFSQSRCDCGVTLDWFFHFVFVFLAGFVARGCWTWVMVSLAVVCTGSFLFFSSSV